MNTVFVLLALFTLYSVDLDWVGAHISWQFPPARSPPLDKLDNKSTKQPCGLPRPPNAKFTTLGTGTAYNFTWRMLYHHLGGLRISLYNSSGVFLTRLVPPADSQEDFFDAGMKQLQTYEISIERECRKCILRIEKEATERSSVYHSCADVNIVPGFKETKAEQVCTEPEFVLSDSSADAQQCVYKCNAGLDGDHCQYKVDCVNDSDCEEDGICFEQSNSVPTRICYCPNGRFGKHCEKESIVMENDCLNVNESDSNAFSNYGIFNEKCYKKLDLNGEDFVYYRVVEKDELELVLDYGTESFVAIGWRPIKQNATCRLFPKLSQRPNGTSGLYKMLTAPLTPMDCTDVVWAAVHKGRTMIRDGYSRDMSTPLEDDWYGGKNSITAVFGFQLEDYIAGNRTIVMFRRKIKAEEPTDNSLGPGQLFGIYAKGHKLGDLSSVVKPALAHQENAERVFFKTDEFRYHGRKNRGVALFDFVSKEEFESVPNSSSKVSSPAFVMLISLLSFRVFVHL